jgi:hypothetical protein
MAKRTSVLRGFSVEDDCYGEGAHLVHVNGECDWRGDAYGMTLPQLMAQATRHARVCNGKRQPQPERPQSAINGFASAWGDVIKLALSTQLAMMPSGGLQATTVYQDELLVPEDQALTIELPRD